MNNNRNIHTIHITPTFYMEAQCRRKPCNYFLICQIITFKEAPTSNSLATTIRRLQPPIFLGSSLMEAPTPQFYGSNQKEAPTWRKLPTPQSFHYNHLSLPRPTTLKYKCQLTDTATVTLSPSICPCKTYHCKICTNNLSQTVTIISSTNQIWSHRSHTHCHKCISQTMYNYVSLIMCHTYTNNKPSVMNAHINQASNPHYYATQSIPITSATHVNQKPSNMYQEI